MVLEQFSIPSTNQNNTTPGITQFLKTLSAQLTSVVDSNQLALNQSVSIGIDQSLKSATTIQVSGNDCPACKLFYDPSVQVDNMSNVVLFNNVAIKIYWIFALDFPSPNFAELREQFIRWNLNYLKMNQFGDNIGLPVQQWWKWDNTKNTNLQIIHNTNITYLGKTFQVSPVGNYTVSMVTINAVIANYLPTA